MKSFLNNLPKLSHDETRRKNAGGNGKTVRDNFTVKKCPLMDNFENMESTTFWKPSSGSAFTPISKKTPVAIEAFQETHIIDKLPNIQGIDLNEKDEKDKDDKKKTTGFIPDRVTSIYIGSLSLVGLFILFRAMNKTK
tara:strand:- start:1930 stop:2343 length:414 start_codon:yes stop_codon:yes gene_type:complete